VCGVGGLRRGRQGAGREASARLLGTLTSPAVSAESEQRVTPLELFFDLVFVFAITQVTALMANDPTWVGLARGLLILTAIWWAWVGYAWLTNEVDPNAGRSRLVVFAAMAAMLVAALAIPGAFGHDGVLFAGAILVVRLLQILLFWFATRQDSELHRQVARLAIGLIIMPTLFVAAAFLDDPAREVAWALILLADYVGAILAGVEGYRISPGHFAERHGLIVIIALGESIVALGVGAGGLEIDLGVIVAAVLGVAVAAALWWAYFDVVAVMAERRLGAAVGRARNAMARDSYSFLHLPMIAGIVLLALGIKKTLGDVDEHLKWESAVALCGGVALYLIAHIAFRWRNVRTFNRHRSVAAVVLLALIPVAHQVPALVSLALVALVCVGLITYEAVRFREARARLRASLT